MIYTLSSSIRFTFCLFLTALLFSGCTQPEPKEPDPVRRKSPIAITNISHPSSNTYVKIVYGQPYKRGRDIFGNVVPYGQIWRTGANEATELTTTRDILFAGNHLDAGTYTLFSIPHKNNRWTIILNDVLGQWGAFDYEKSHDVMRVEVPASQTKSVTEAFTIKFSEIKKDSTNILMKWDKTVVRIPVEFIEQ